ncbi:MAG TPA: GH25 family lysozyme, partial [Phnomibacter sp.]|nr:GH25 family lysozyme [Phnomibacter sp.]
MARGRQNMGWIGILFVVFLFLGYRYLQGLKPFAPGGDDDRETTFKLYPGFGIELPQAYMIHGIDVSRYQRTVNWRLVKGMRNHDVQLGFAFMKATEGSGLNDPQFPRNWRKSREAGMVRGA